MMPIFTKHPLRAWPQRDIGRRGTGRFRKGEVWRGGSSGGRGTREGQTETEVKGTVGVYVHKTLKPEI